MQEENAFVEKAKQILMVLVSNQIKKKELVKKIMEEMEEMVEMEEMEEMEEMVEMED